MYQYFILLLSSVCVRACMNACVRVCVCGCFIANVSKKFRRFRDNFVNFPRYQLSRLEGVSAIGPTATLL